LKTCSKCGSENRDGAAFCSKCGSELPHEDGIKGWWKRQNRSSKFLIITPFAILALILLLGAFTEPSGYSDVNYDDATVYDDDAADVSGASSTKTFEGSGISFSYPATWNIYTPDESDDDSVVSLESYQQGMYSILSVYRKPNTLDLETLRDCWIEGFYNIGNEVTYVKETTVDGNRAYIVGSSFYNSETGEGEHECVVFIEGGYSYEILFTSEDISTIRDDIDTIIHSFRVD